MTTNQERAVAVILGRTATAAARALADAGLLAPDAPEPAVRPFPGHPAASLEWPAGEWRVSVYGRDEVLLCNDDTYDVSYIDMLDAEPVAAAILAAARDARKGDR